MISRHKMAELLGVTPDTLRGWQDRHWQKGVHYVVIGKTTMLDAREIRKWLKSRKELSTEGRGELCSTDSQMCIWPDDSKRMKSVN